MRVVLDIAAFLRCASRWDGGSASANADAGGGGVLVCEEGCFWIWVVGGQCGDGVGGGWWEGARTG